MPKANYLHFPRFCIIMVNGGRLLFEIIIIVMNCISYKFFYVIVTVLIDVSFCYTVRQLTTRGVCPLKKMMLAHKPITRHERYFMNCYSITEIKKITTGNNRY